MHDPEQTVSPGVPTRHRGPRSTHAQPAGEDQEAADEGTSPFPYAEKFEQWVDDETAARDGRQPPDVTDRGDTPR